MDEAALESEVGVYHEERMREIASRPNTTVLRAERHGEHHEPWDTGRLRAVMSRLVERVLAFPEDAPSVDVQIRCLRSADGKEKDEEMCQFYREHPKTYLMLTDTAVMRDPRSRNIVLAMIDVRQKQERGEVASEREADALATRHVMTALGVDLKLPPATPPRRP